MDLFNFWILTNTKFFFSNSPWEYVLGLEIMNSPQTYLARSIWDSTQNHSCGEFETNFVFVKIQNENKSNSPYIVKFTFKFIFNIKFLRLIYIKPKPQYFHTKKYIKKFYKTKHSLKGFCLIYIWKMGVFIEFILFLR